MVGQRWSSCRSAQRARRAGAAAHRHPARGSRSAADRAPQPDGRRGRRCGAGCRHHGRLEWLDHAGMVATLHISEYTASTLGGAPASRTPSSLIAGQPERERVLGTPARQCLAAGLSPAHESPRPSVEPPVSSCPPHLGDQRQHVAPLVCTAMSAAEPLKFSPGASQHLTILLEPPAASPDLRGSDPCLAGILITCRRAGRG